MKKQKITIENIPALIWGESSGNVYLWVHGKMSRKEEAEAFAEIAQTKGYQVLSFDLPRHGERAEEADRCDIWNGVRDLTLTADYAFRHWARVSLYACSLGAFFALHAYGDRPFEICLFQSPIVDMEYLIRQMMLWFDVPEERLAREKEVDTPIDVLSWEYFQYVLENPIRRWPIPTHILFGGRDSLQTREIMEGFARRFGCELTVAENSEHPFATEEDREIVSRWLREKR